MVLSGGHSGCPAATSSPGPPHCITPGCTMHRAGNTMCSSALEFLVTAWLRTLMTGIGNRLGGTAGSREGRALCHPVLMEGGMNYSVGLGWGVEAGKKDLWRRRFGLGSEESAGAHQMGLHWRFTLPGAFLTHKSCEDTQRWAWASWTRQSEAGLPGYQYLGGKLSPRKGQR